jgi:phenylpyruvate tautomerase PptA (4-oxalocrotonate tautomerase family)
LATLNSPREDRFQIITTHGDDLVYSPDYLGIQRSDEIVIVQIMIFPGKPVELKQKLVSSIAQQLHFSVGIRLEDVMVILHEVAKENWSFGNGVAQHVTGN